RTGGDDPASLREAFPQLSAPERCADAAGNEEIALPSRLREYPGPPAQGVLGRRAAARFGTLPALDRHGCVPDPWLPDPPRPLITAAELERLAFDGAADDHGLRGVPAAMERPDIVIGQRAKQVGPPGRVVSQRVIGVNGAGCGGHRVAQPVPPQFDFIF